MTLFEAGTKVAGFVGILGLPCAVKRNLLYEEMGGDEYPPADARVSDSLGDGSDRSPVGVADQDAAAEANFVEDARQCVVSFSF